MTSSAWISTGVRRDPPELVRFIRFIEALTVVWIGNSVCDFVYMVLS